MDIPFDSGDGVLRLRQHRSKPASKKSRARPPTTPPAIAPALDRWDAKELEEPAAAVVETVAVTALVTVLIIVSTLPARVVVIVTVLLLSMTVKEPGAALRLPPAPGLLVLPGRTLPDPVRDAEVSSVYLIPVLLNKTIAHK